MSVKKIDRAALNSWVESCIAARTVYGVQAKGERFVFGRLHRAEDLRLDYDVTILPPKKYFQPQQEALLRFDRNGDCESVLADDPFVLLGVHPYDMVAISQMDTVFTQDEKDIHYMRRRENAVIVVSDVEMASPNVFAGCMGTATVDKGFDVLLTRIGDTYLVDARTAKGEELIRELAEAPNAEEADLQAREEVWKENTELLRRHDLRVPLTELPGLLAESAEHPVWAEKARDCYSCGSCNLVCPTCYCFDVKDEVDWDLQCGKRCRTWDACLLKDFAIVAGNHNFRRRRKDRYRHRYYRKGQYMPEKMGEVACIGCGRCITACTTKIANPVEVYNALLEKTE